jgi:hypothetical protein
MKKELIIAVYNEDISWINNINSVDKIIVYNKGDRNIFTNNPNIEVIKLPNVGREAHTFIYHIVENYEKLADHTIFLQGDPFYHSHLTPETINDDIRKHNYKNMREPAFNGCDTQDENLVHDWTGLCKGIYSKYLQGSAPEIYFSAGAQWIVPRNCIRHKSIGLYQDLLQELSIHRVTNTDGIVNAWTAEGLFNYLFDEANEERESFEVSNETTQAFNESIIYYHRKLSGQI